MVRVQTLGGLRIERAGEVVRDLPSQPVRCALFLYLAVERTATRDSLVALLWPDREAERARRSLSQTLYELRRRLGEDWVVVAGDRLEIAPEVEVDALSFERAAQSGRDEDALGLYGGAFLEGCHLGGSPAFEGWVERRGSQLARAFRQVCQRITRSRADAGDLEGALGAAHRWAEVDPLEDEAHHAVIDLLARLGRRSEALRHFEDYRVLIARELEVEPLEQTLELVSRIREGGAVAPPPDPSSDGDRTATPEAPVEGGPGREPRPRPRRMWRALPLSVAGALALVAGLLLWRGGSAVSTPARALDPDAIAVLPFVHLGDDPRDRYFSDGVTEDVLTSVSRIPRLRVISRASVMRYREREMPSREIAGELGVRYLLEGSVRRDGQRVRITAQLIDAQADAHVWADAYDRRLSDVLAIQEEIAGRIAQQLRRELVEADGARRGGHRPEAYDLLLRGREYLNRPGDADTRKYAPAVAYFRRALAIDPGYARAHVGLSEAFRSQVSLPFPVRRDSAVHHARRAVALDPESAEAAAALGHALLATGEHRAAEREFVRALQLDPNHADALDGLARLAWIDGRVDEAVRWQRRTVQVDPLSTFALSTLGGYLLELGDLEAAADAYRRAISLAPDAPVSPFMLAQILLIQGDPRGADDRMRALRDAASGHPGTHFLLGRFEAQRGRFDTAGPLLESAAAGLGDGVGATLALQRAYVARKSGQEEAASRLLAQAAAEIAAHERVGLRANRLRLQLHALSDDRAQALRLLRREGRDVVVDRLAGPHLGIYWLDRDPLLEALHGDPSFQSFLREQRAQLDSMRLRARRSNLP